MKVLAIDSSPHGESMDILLGPYLEGMRDAGAEVELYYGRDLVIYPCCGNLNCTVRTPGKCMAYDDMRWLRKKMGEADALVLASPLYFSGVTGPEGATASMKSLQERLVPSMEPSVDVPYEHAVHTIREEVSLRKVVLVTGCGYWEVDGLNPMLTHIKAFCTNSYPGFEGNILEPRSAILRGALKNGASGDEIFQAARDAGRRLMLEYKAPSGYGRRMAHPLTASPHLKKRDWDNVILYRF